jgi:Aspartyl protease
MLNLISMHHRPVRALIAITFTVGVALSVPTLATENNAQSTGVLSADPKDAVSITTTSVEPSVPSPTTEEIVVEGTEPRYVAPTFRDRIGRIWAPVYLDDKGPFRLVLDTGATGSAVLESVAKKLGKPIDQSHKVMLRGATGSAEVPYIDVDTLAVGELILSGTRLPIVADVFGGADGILGAAGFADKRVFIDFKNDIIRINRSHRETPPLGYGTIPFKVSHNHLPTFDLIIGKVRTKAILDTGAQQTVGNEALRVALAKRSHDEVPQQIIGVTLDVAYGQAIRTPPIDLPGVTVRNLYVTFGDMYIFEHWKLTNEPALIVGMDLIGTFGQVIIDYRTQDIYIRAR